MSPLDLMDSMGHAPQKSNMAHITDQYGPYY